MRNITKGTLIGALAIFLLMAFCAVSFADVVVTHEPYFHTGAGPIASIFYWIGDIIILPFRLLGDLFAAIF